MSTSVRLSLLDHLTQTGVTVRVALDAATTTSELMGVLAPYRPSDGELYLGERTLASFSSVAEMGLTDGQIISVGGPGEPLFDREPHQGMDLLVVSGPDAGRVVPLAPGRHTIGRDPANSVAIADKEVSRVHAQVDVGVGTAAITDLASVNGTIVDGVPATGTVPLDGTETIRIGRTAVLIVAPEPADTALVRGSDGTVTYNRRFRTASPQPPDRVDFPDPFVEEPPPSMSLIYIVAPLIGGVIMALLIDPRFLLFAVLGPITGVGGMIASRRAHAARQRRMRAVHDQQLAAAQNAFVHAIALETRVRRDAAPDPATLVRAARGPRRRLWERRTSDPDFLAVRVGLADLPSAVVTRGGLAPPATTLPAVPVTIPLVDAGSIGIAGSPRVAEGVARNLLFQVATLHSPSEVRIVVVSADASWSWTRWLPHARADGGPALLIGSDPASTRARLDELQRLIDARRSSRSAYGGAPSVIPRFVILFDHPSRLDRSQVHRILAEGPAVGVHAICIEDTEPELPEDHAGASIAEAGAGLTVRIRNRPPVGDVVEEIIHSAHADIASRCLAPLRPESTDAADLPVSSRFLDLIGMETPTAAAIATGWAGRDPRCRATVGIAASGPFAIELDDRAPHGLIAGTSGAGKSEFLKTFLASLALSSHPDDLQFLLIDFKGGGDFRTLARLPHTVDLVTNTDDDGDGQAVTRALGLLGAEVERRQRLVNEHDARDLATYRAARAHAPAMPTLGRLLVVADEFGELASSRPELLDKLVRVARVGRALGVHLLLATQRPSGSITSQIQANVPLRVCFRVLDGEADEVIATSAPERISRDAAGRGFVRYGDDAPVEVQCARVANARPELRTAAEPVTVDVEAWSTIGHAAAGPGRGPEVPDADTDLWVLVEAAIAAARDIGWRENPVPWTRPLPGELRFDPTTASATGASGRPAAVIGQRDDPRLQRHVPHLVELGGPSIAVAGSPGSGRTTAIRTICAALAYAAPPDHLTVHALDLAGGGLRSLLALPHVGTVTDDLGLWTRLLDHLEDEVDRRRGEFAVNGWSNLAEQWASVPPEERSPVLLVAIDGWDRVRDLPGTGRSKSPSERILRLIGDGNGVGVQAVVAGDRYAASGAVGKLIGHRLILRFNDPTDYGNVDVDARRVPKPHLPGRAMVPSPGAVPAEVQIAHVGITPDGPTQVAGLKVLGAHLATHPRAGTARPLRLASLPMRAPLDAILRASGPDEAPSAGAAERWLVPIALGGDEAKPVWIDLQERRPGVTIAGGHGSGRSTALRAVARSLGHAGVRVIPLFVDDSPVATLGPADGTEPARRWADLDAAAIADAIGAGPAAFVVDDADRIDKRDPVMQAIVDAAPSGCRLIAAGATETWRDTTGGWLRELRQSGTGLLLWPRTAFDANAIGLATSISAEQQFSRPPGRALLADRGDLQIVQVPYA